MLVQDHQLKDIFCRFEIFLKLSLPNLFQSYLSEVWMKTIVLFQAYDTSHRLDNSLLQITLNITLRSQNNKEQKYNNDATHYLLTNRIMLICVFTVCSCREGDLVFSRPLTRTQVNNHWTKNAWGQSFDFLLIMWNGSYPPANTLAWRGGPRLASPQRIASLSRPNLASKVDSPLISKLCQKKKKGRENAHDFKIQNLFSGVAQSLPPMFATHLQWQVMCHVVYYSFLLFPLK